MCKCAIAHFSLFENVQKNVLSHFKKSKYGKMCKFPNCTFFAQKKEQSHISKCAIAQPY